MDDDDVDAALDAFFGEDALLEALQDAPDMEAQADAFKVPGAPQQKKAAFSQPFACGVEEDLETQMSSDSSSFAVVERQQGQHRKSSREQTLSGSNCATNDAKASNPSAVGRRPAAKGKATRTWRGTMVVILTSLVIWACILIVWGGPGDVGSTSVSTLDGTLASEAAPAGSKKEKLTWKDIRLPGWAAAGSDEGSLGTPAPRGRVDVSLSSASAVSGNATGEALDGNNTNATAGDGAAKSHQRSRRGARQHGIGAGH
eukprot:TRINITY_DN19338_c0_g2_i1.p1 TRINITY_DN19338_c0_g2~~TRINITY_DN19338_c0_g2_i1.p1  ORF type:complete len:258 (+),score=55.71 TRINITY_DN19338_c0_g2_i1:43-816(+)